MPVVESSMMKQVEYRSAERELDITFQSGRTYTYIAIMPEVYKELLAADSKGRFFRDEIDGAYSYAESRPRRR